MRKILLATTIVALGLSFPVASFAAKAPQQTAPKHKSEHVIRGTITAVNASTKQINVETKKGQPPETITVSDVSSLKDEMKVKILLEEGTTDQAQSIKVYTHKKRE